MPRLEKQGKPRLELEDEKAVHGSTAPALADGRRFFDVFVDSTAPSAYTIHAREFLHHR